MILHPMPGGFIRRSVGGRPCIFYGWWVVFIAALGALLGPAPIIALSFGVFVAPLGREFHAGRAEISLAFGLFNLALAVACPFVGRMADRHGARKIILLCTAAFGASLVSSQAISSNLWELYFFYMASGVVASGPVLLYCKVVSQWFDRRRGLALGLMMAGFGLGATVMPPIEQRLIAAFGWRAAYAILGAAVLLVVLPVVAVFLKERPEEVGLLPDGESQAPSVALAPDGEPGMSGHDARRTATFWIMLCAFFLASASVHACFIHMPEILAGRGATVRAAALASSVLGAGMLITRLFAGYLLDRFFGPYVAVVFFTGLGLGIALLRLSSGTEAAFVAAFLAGVGLGAEGDIIAYLTSRYFGLRAYGEVYAYYFAAFVLAGGLGAYLMGAGFDWTGSYAAPLVGFLIATALAVLLMFRLGPYRYGARPAGESG